jgi:hypothetical protein
MALLASLSGSLGSSTPHLPPDNRHYWWDFGEATKAVSF